MIVLAIDPGISGAFAWCDGNKLIAVEDMPTIEVRGKRRVSAANVSRIMQLYSVDLVVIEAVHSMPGQGVSSSFGFGRSLGVLEGVSAGLGLPVEMAVPAVWKRLAGVPADKGAVRQMATQYWPFQAELFKRAKDDGRADAALMARWAAMRQR